MYINLVLGGIALVVIWLYLKKILVKEDVLKENPADLLEKEIARRRAKEEEAAKVFERMRDRTKARLRPVAEALEPMRAALPEAAREALFWEDAGETLTISMRGKEKDASLTVAWRIPQVDLRAIAAYDNDAGVYVLRRSDTGKEESVASLDACVQRITSFIVDLME